MSAPLKASCGFGQATSECRIGPSDWALGAMQGLPGPSDMWLPAVSCLLRACEHHKGLVFFESAVEPCFSKTFLKKT